ncbi:MAG TPA: serine/threonine-protein kinase [Vicinamibacterales bacterium]
MDDGAPPLVRVTDSTSTLPEDLLHEQCVRIQVLHASGVLLWAINLVMDVSLTPHGDRGPYRLAIEAAGALLAAAAACYTRFGRSSARVKIDIGMALVVPHALGLALLNSWTAQPTTMRPLSGVTVLILFFGMLAPARPTTTLVTTLIAASMDPLCVWIAHLRGLPVPSPILTVLMFYPNYVCAVLAVAPARLLYRLGRQIREARALGSYELVELLGKGGMGEVWLGRHRLLARHAAIKLVPPELVGGGEQAITTLRRFEREAHATAALSSPHTIRLFDYGAASDGTFYYVMELLDGVDLETLVREFGPLPPSRAMYIVQQICRSLAEAHAIGVIHRDIKPANVYVCRMGLEYDFVKVLDFGLVKMNDRMQGATLLTAEPAIMGTPAYMAPEAILADPAADHRVDLYAVGCLAYFLLTGVRVFAGDTTMKLLMQQVQNEPVPPSSRTELSIPRAIDDLVMACLRKDPAARPRDAEDVQQRAALACRGLEPWDRTRATEWWKAHLPQRTKVGAITLPSHHSSVGASVHVSAIDAVRM